MSKVYHLQRTQLLKSDLPTAWAFFSSPQNLAAITPPELKFTVTSAKQEEMYAGQIIEYTVRPLFNIPLYWMTEITHTETNKFFCDEQRFGPYSFWHHQHHFSAVAGGTEMKDIVHYKLPFWFLGDIANTLFVKKQLEQIFDFRLKKTAALFG